MNKRSYSSGLFYCTSTKRILLYSPGKNPSARSWRFIGSSYKNKKGQQPVNALRSEIYKKLGLESTTSSIRKLYDYANAKTKKHNYVFFITTSKEIKFKNLSSKSMVSWFSLKKAWKLNLSKQTRKDLFFFQKKLIAAEKFNFL